MNPRSLLCIQDAADAASCTSGAPFRALCAPPGPQCTLQQGPTYAIDPRKRGAPSSGGETRTHNLRIDSPIRHDPLTRRNARKRILSRRFDCSPACSVLHWFSPPRVLRASR
jgi:hypothetical protein